MKLEDYFKRKENILPTDWSRFRDIDGALVYLLSNNNYHEISSTFGDPMECQLNDHSDLTLSIHRIFSNKKL